MIEYDNDLICLKTSKKKISLFADDEYFTTSSERTFTRASQVDDSRHFLKVLNIQT